MEMPHLCSLGNHLKKHFPRKRRFTPNNKLMKIALAKTVVVSVVLSVGTAVSHAQIGLTANDSAGSTSFNAAGHWSNNQAPSAANDYNTGGYQLRSPGDANNYTFAGASLTFSNNSLAGSGNGSFLDKFSGGSGSSRTLTINNLTNLAGALVRSGAANGTIVHIAGNHFTIAGSSELRADQTSWIIDSPLLGSDSIILTNHYSNNNPANHISYTANNSGFTGSWYIFGDGANASTYVELQSASSQPGNPSTFNPAQITLGPNGLLLDTAGTTFTNSNGGFTFNGNATINSPSVTFIGEPITGGFSLTETGGGTLVLSNANNTYTGGTIISVGTLRLGVNNAIPGNSIAGDVTVNGTLDMNGNNAAINGLNGSGTVDTSSGGTPTLTVGANGDSGTFSGTVQNSSGTLSLTKTGAGTQTISGTYTCSGTTTISGGTLAFATASPATPGNLIINNSALAVTLSSGVNGLNVSGSLTLQDNATNNILFGGLTANPTEIAINVTGGISAPGTNIVINVSALGLKAGTFTVIKYTGTALASIANFTLNLPPGVFGTLVNNTGNDSIDVNITATPNQLSWYGTAGGSWDLITPNWSNYVAGGTTVFQQYTNNGVVAGDSVVFDDTLTNSSPQPTNITLNSTFFAFPVVFNGSLPYSISGTGGIAGPTSLVISNTGSVSLLTSNSFTGAVSVYGGTLVITNDDALGTNNGLLTLNGGSLQINGSTTNNVRPVSLPVATIVGVGSGANARFGGPVSGVTLSKGDLGTLILGGTNVYSGDLFVNSGTVVIDSGLVTNNTYDSIGQQNTDNGTLTIQGTGALFESADFNVGDIGSSVGTLNMSGSAKLIAGQIFIASANAAGSTAQGTVNQNGGTVTELNQTTGNFVIGGRTSSNGVAIYNLNSGTLTAAGNVRLGSQATGTLNQNGGTFYATNGINIARFANSAGTYNLNAGTLVTSNLASSTGVNALFNFNGGTLKATPVSQPTWVSALSQVNIQGNGAFLDDSGNTLTIANALSAGSGSGGVTKQGSGTITLAGTNTFTGPITNNAGTLFLNSPSTYAGAAQVNAGTLQLSSTSVLQGAAAVKTNATFAVIQSGSSTATIGNLTLNGAAALPGATFSVTLSGANVGTVPFVNAATLTLNGTNTVSVTGAIPLGPTAIVQYTGAIAGSGTLTNLILPQGASGYVSNNAASSTLYVVVTNAGPGLVWTGTNSAASRTNVWDILSSTNWLVNGKPTWYQQFVIPGDAVTFNDTGSGTVLLSNTVGPASVVISNNARNYTFSGPGLITGNTGLTKLGTGTVVINLTNNNYSGNTAISNGTLQVGNSAAISATANLVVGSNGTFEVNGQSPTGGDLIGSGIVDDSAGDMLLTIGGSSGGIWNGTIQDQGRGGFALTKNGSGTWVVGGTNTLNNGSPFQFQNQFAAGTTIITNGGAIVSPLCQTWIANGAGSTATMIVSGGTLFVSNNILTIGNSTNANGTLIVNSGTVIHGGDVNNVFGAANDLFVGGVGGTGTLTVNGGEVLNSQALVLGQNPTGSGTLNLNGGLVQATVVQPNNSPATSVANFNGGTLQAVTNSTDFIQVTSMIMSNGLVLDDGGFAVSIVSQALQPGDGLNGGLVKKGSGTVYLDSAETFTGTTLVSNGTLSGSGSIESPLVVGPAGNVSPGDAGASAGNSLTVNGNVTLQGTATFRVSVNGGSSVSDSIQGVTNASYGGTLVVSNVTSDSTLMTNGQSFLLFNAVSGTGNFANIVGSPGVGLSYVFHPATGVLSVTNAVVKSIPHFTHVSVSGTTLSLSATNGTANGQYVLLGTTNVALPIAQWTPLLTNTFDSGGNLNLTTNIVDPTVLHEFYLLLQ